MGFERGPGFLRTPPRGWIAARAFPVEHAVLEEHGDAEGHRGGVIDTSHRLQVTWEVEVEGREPARFSEERRAPAWIVDTSPSGKRWYKPRLRPSYGLQRSLGVPAVVDPGDPTQLWVDWDAAYAEHVEAWERKARIDREIASREGGFEKVTQRLFNPLHGKLRHDEEPLVEQEIARRTARDEAIREQAIAADRERMAARGIEPVTADDDAEVGRRIAQLERLEREGRKAGAVVVAHADTGRTLANMQVIEITLDVDDEAGAWRVTYEHIWGPRHAKAYGPGKRVKVRVDPDDPHLVELA